MKVIQLDEKGYFVGTTVAEESPLEPGVYLMPANTVDADVPSIPDGSVAKWSGSGWVFEEIIVDVEPEPEPIAEEVVVRGERDDLLQGSDWTQVADAPVDQAAWAAYRQALRDITQQDGFPHEVVWPEKPV